MSSSVGHWINKWMKWAYNLCLVGQWEKPWWRYPRDTWACARYWVGLEVEIFDRLLKEILCNGKREQNIMGNTIFNSIKRFIRGVWVGIDMGEWGCSVEVKECVQKYREIVQSKSTYFEEWRQNYFFNKESHLDYKQS